MFFTELFVLHVDVCLCLRAETLVHLSLLLDGLLVLLKLLGRLLVSPLVVDLEEK